VDDDFHFPWRRAFLFYAGLAAGLFVLGAVWAVTANHALVFCVAAFYYIAAGGLACYGVFSQASNRYDYVGLPIKERREAFWTQMFFLLEAALLVGTALLLQVVF
jgi:hypothetical protein